MKRIINLYYNSFLSVIVDFVIVLGREGLSKAGVLHPEDMMWYRIDCLKVGPSM